MKVEVTRYRKPGGYLTRYWSVLVNGELLAVTLYRKGAVAVARAITKTNQDPHVTLLEDSANPAATPPSCAPNPSAARHRPAWTDRQAPNALRPKEPHATAIAADDWRAPSPNSFANSLIRLSDAL